MKTKLLTVAIVLVVALGGLWMLRTTIARFFPIDHEGVVKRISPFHKGGIVSKAEKTRQLNQFAIIFEDGMMCEGTDTSFAAIKEGDRIAIRGYHDVSGFPILDPEWMECDEAQLVRLD